MAVQQSKVSRSKRNMRRSHDGLSKPTISADTATGETHRRHHISPQGYYKGRQVIDKNPTVDDEDNNEE